MSKLKHNTSCICVDCIDAAIRFAKDDRIAELTATVERLTAENTALRKRLADILRHWQNGVSELDTPWRRTMAELVGDVDGLKETING